MTDKVKAYILAQKMASPGARILVAVSGGADSMALLDILLSLQNECAWDAVAAAHIHHGLRGDEADRDEQAVKAFCSARQIPLFVHHEQVAAVAKEQHIGLEEAGRLVRYRFLDTIAQQENFTHIATAHTLCDNTETMMAHITRGTGLSGLRGIPATRGHIIRPLLSCTREEIEAYCRKRNLSYVTDSTNADNVYTRNRIRNRVIPELYHINPRVHEAFSRLSLMAQEDEAYLQQEAAKAGEDVTVSPSVYDAQKIHTFPPAIARRVLQRLIAKETGLSAQETHIRQIITYLDGTGAISLACGVTATIKQGYLTFTKSEHQIPVKQPLVPGNIYQFGDTQYACAVWEREKFKNYQKIHKILLQYTCDYDKIKGVAYVRSRCAGDECTPYRRGGRRTLKKWLNAQRIPASRRDFIPIVEDEEGIALVVGLGCDRRTAIEDSTKRVLVFWILEKEGVTNA